MYKCMVHAHVDKIQQNRFDIDECLGDTSHHVDIHHAASSTYTFTKID